MFAEKEASLYWFMNSNMIKPEQFDQQMEAKASKSVLLKEW